jgi:hypothetical protein
MVFRRFSFLSRGDSDKDRASARGLMDSRHSIIPSYPAFWAIWLGT